MFKLAVLMVVLVALFALVVAAVMPHLNFCTGSTDPGVQQACKLLGQSSARPTPVSTALAPMWLVAMIYRFIRALVCRFGNEHDTNSYASFTAWSDGPISATFENCQVLDMSSAELCLTVPWLGWQIVVEATQGNPEDCQPGLRCSIGHA